MAVVKNASAFRRRRAADTARWRERLRRGAAVYQVEVDDTTFDLMERFAGLNVGQMDDGGECGARTNLAVCRTNLYNRIAIAASEPVMFAVDPKEPLLRHIRSMRPDLVVDESMSVNKLADLLCDISGSSSRRDVDGVESSASQEAPTDTAEPGKPDAGGASAAVTMSWVEMTVRQTIEAEREQEREFWIEIFAQLLAAEQRKASAIERRLDDVERRSSLEAQFHELEVRLDARQLARDEEKRGPPGRRGERGERGPQGERGPKGEPGRDAAKIAGWEVDDKNYLVHPVMSDGTRGAALDFKPLLTQFLADTQL
jgi:hypothetical protein